MAKLRPLVDLAPVEAQEDRLQCPDCQRWVKLLYVPVNDTVPRCPSCLAQLPSPPRGGDGEG